MNTLTLFAGAGGADLGMQRAGCRHLACTEGDATAVATLVAAGFPGVRAWIGTPPEGSDVPAWTYSGEQVDLLWASPPCQPYSAAGSRKGHEDSRDGWPATLAAIQAIRPEWVIIENVSGAPVQEWAADLGGLFARYRYRDVSYRTLDAADWGLPSHRTRQFLVAGPRPYRWPEPTHSGPDAPSAARLRLPPWVGFGEALGLVDGAGYLERTPRPDIAADQPIGALRIGGGYLLLPSACVVATEEKGHTNPHLLRGRDNPVNRASDSLFLATGRRRLTWQECAILLGFPPGYPFQGGIGAKYRQIGNAVAPVMAEALARNIVQELPG